MEVVDYVKDFVTGKVDVLKKIKPVGASVNTCLLELFDLKGNKVKESFSHNIVNEFQNRQAFLHYFYDLIRVNNNEINTRNPFANIILSDYDGNENANELGLRGNVIGWANKVTPYAGSDILRGTINQTESETRDIKRTGLIKTVFDFATSAANGDIKSVWWAYGDSSDYRYHGYPFWQFSANTTGVDWACDGNYIYAAQNSGTILRYNMDGSTGVSSIDFSGTDTGINGIEFDGTYFWLYNPTTKKAYKCNTSFVVQSQFTATDVTGSFVSLTVFNSKIFIATTANLYRYSSVGTYETLKSATTAYGLDSTGILKVKANNAYCHIIARNGSIYYYGFLDGNGDLIFKQNVSADGISTDTPYAFVRNSDYNNSRLFIKRRSGGGTIHHAVIGGIGAHNKLAATVPKTSANPLKVTYTFDIALENTLTW
jgi:hypothetical protein